jgi:1D-myo-inositol-tetrakisphosphate 5-kinase/inositol-polyphosphate multikinase
MIRVLRGILDQLRSVRTAVNKFEWRVRGGSVLVVYEGDQAALESAFSRLDQEEAENGGDKAGDGDSDDDSDYDEEDEDDATLPFVVRLIDFAHAKEGVGVDEGYNLGLSTLSTLIATRLKQVKNLADD